MKKNISLAAICFLVYLAGYSARSVLSPMVPIVSSNTVFTPLELNKMGSLFFLLYGLGQFMSGILGDVFNPKKMVAAGVFITGLLMICFTFLTNKSAALALWGICGLALSLLWGPLTKIIAENTDPQFGTLCLTALTVSSVIGTFVAYIFAAVASFAMHWRLAFYLASLLLAIALATWIVITYRLEAKGQLIYKAPPPRHKVISKELFERIKGQGFVWMVGVAVASGIVRNAVSFLVPSYLVEWMQVPPGVAPIITSVMPIVSIGGTIFGVHLLKRFNGKDNEFLAISVLSVVSTLFFLLMYFTDSLYFAVALICLFISNASMTSINNIIFSKYCLRFNESGYISTLVGFMNFASYFGAGIANIAFSGIVSRIGWHQIVLVWGAIAMMSALFSIVSLRQLKTARHNAG